MLAAFGPQDACPKNRAAASAVISALAGATDTTTMFETSGPGAGFATVTAATCPVRARAVPVAVSLDVETKVVVSGEPAKLTWAPGANPVPAIVMLKDPIGMVEGVMPVT